MTHTGETAHTLPFNFDEKLIPSVSMNNWPFIAHKVVLYNDLKESEPIL